MATSVEEMVMLALVHRHDPLMAINMTSPDPQIVYDPIHGETPIWFYNAMKEL